MNLDEAIIFYDKNKTKIMIFESKGFSNSGLDIMIFKKTKEGEYGESTCLLSLNETQTELFINALKEKLY